MNDDKLLINEIFTSLQGEGIFVGQPSTFVRVSGCNLRCIWCDTPQTSWKPVGEPMLLEEIAERCNHGPRHVVLTGGEPLMFQQSEALTQILRRQGHYITIETAGTRFLEYIECDLLSISPKLSMSTPWERDRRLAVKHEAARIDFPVLRQLMKRSAYQLKFVVSIDREARARCMAEIHALLEQLELPVELEKVLLMPECTATEALQHAYLELMEDCLRTGFRLGQRLHIHMFGNKPGT